MKKLHPIQYPTNRAKAIRYVRHLNSKWESMKAIPDRRGRCKVILKIVKETQSVLSNLQEIINKDKDNHDIVAAERVINKWYKAHWRRR